MGPHCPYATTVEVAYPLREVSRVYDKFGMPLIHLRAIIPEPNLWDPVSPFLYRVAMELWQDGERCDLRDYMHGLRQFSLGPRGISWNGRLLILHAVQRKRELETEASQLRQLGCNTIIAPVAGRTAALWDVADRLGFIVLGRISSEMEMFQKFILRRHPSCLGWVVTPEFLDQKVLRPGAETLLGADGQLVGLELEAPPLEPLPEVVSFVACKESVLPRIAALKLPKLILRSEKAAHTSDPSEQMPPPGILGWVE
jgi:hypothetical protein